MRNRKEQLAHHFMQIIITAFKLLLLFFLPIVFGYVCYQKREKEQALILDGVSLTANESGDNESVIGWLLNEVNKNYQLDKDSFAVNLAEIMQKNAVKVNPESFDNLQVSLKPDNISLSSVKR